MLANCVVCGKPFDAQGAAKTCSTECRKVRRRERERAWYAANPEKVCEKNRARYWANPEKAREQNKAWYAANPEKAREYFRAWRAANPEKVFEADRARQSKRKRQRFLQTLEKMEAVLC